MKATELMIGDWVLLDSRTPYQIIEFDRYNVCLGGFIGEVDIMDIDPIRITQEILEKNGIVYDYDETECVADYRYVKIRGYQFHDADNGILIDYCNGHIKIVNDYIGTIDMDINYVHELQHALRLCGIEKEIIL